MRSQMLRFGTALIALTALPLHATAQSPLSLSDAVKQALDHHEDAAIALIRLKQAEARERQVLARLFPQLQARASVVYLPASKSEFADLGTCLLYTSPSPRD